MAKWKRSRKLKVYSTPIGFHDALVAAPSQKAALEAWGAGTNLFSQGSAHVVTDPRLTKVPLEHPGQVVRLLRASEAEQLAALDKPESAIRGKAAKAEILPKKAKTRLRKPSRAAVTRSEQALATLESKQAERVDRMEKQRKALEQKIREAKRRNERERDEAQEKVDEAREAYQRAIERYESG
jgi:hypothetical protein